MWLRPYAFSASASSHSPISLVSPYGDSGPVAVASVTRSVSGVPYVAALEENTTLSTPAFFIARSSEMVAVTFCS